MSEPPTAAVHPGDTHPLVRSCMAQAVEVEEHHHVAEFRRKFSTRLHSDVLDYLHFHPAALERMCITLARIFGNVLDHPEEEKYRKVKDASKLFQTDVASINRADSLLLAAHWRPKVVDMAKSWCFSGEPGSREFAELGEARAVLDKAITALHDKAERKAREDAARLGVSTAEKERIRLQLEDDRKQRAQQAELTRVHAPVAAQPLPSEDPRRYGRAGGGDGGYMMEGPPGMHGGMHGGGPGGEEEEEQEEEEGL